MFTPVGSLLPQAPHIKAGYPLAGPYSKAIVYHDLIYLSGIIPLDESGKQMVGTDTATQIQRVFEVLHDILLENSSSMRECINITVYLASFEDFPLMNKIYQSFFATHCPDGYLPARSTVQAGIYGGAAIEIQVTAAIHHSSSQTLP